MENSKFVLGLLESVLGKSVPDKNGMDHTFMCPVCNHKKPKLVVNVVTGTYNCWTCFPPTKGKTPVNLLKKIHASSEVINEMRSYFKSGAGEVIETKHSAVALPKEFVPLSTANKSLSYKKAMAYLKSRGVTDYDIKKHNIGYCDTGKYENKIVIPSYDNKGMINYFVARSFDKNAFRKFDSPSCEKSSIIGFEQLINWNVPVILCEGVFDAIAIKRNAIPLFGKTIPKALMLKLASSNVKTIYLALDTDALREALSYAERLLNLGKDVYLIQLNGKDPSEIGFEGMVKILHTAEKLSIEELLYKKMLNSLQLA